MADSPIGFSLTLTAFADDLAPGIAVDHASATMPAMTFERVAWILTVLVALLTAFLLLLAGYTGYAGLSAAVAAAAAINLS
jgi:hypothetical protein